MPQLLDGVYATGFVSSKSGQVRVAAGQEALETMNMCSGNPSSCGWCHVEGKVPGKLPNLNLVI